MTEKPGIYHIKCLPTGQKYVGGCMNISKRWSRHRADLRAGIHLNKKLQAAWNKFGEDRFHFKVLEFTTQLKAREQHWMDKLKAVTEGFNDCPFAGTTKGRKFSEIEKKARRPHILKMVAMAQSEEVRAKRAATRIKDRTLGQKLFPEQVIKIRKLFKKGWTQTALGERFGVHHITVFDVVHRNTWRHIP